MSLQVEKIHDCTGHNAALYALAPSLAPRHFLTAGGDGWVVEWDMDRPELGKLLASVETQVFALCSLVEQNRIVAGNMNGGLHWIDLAAPDQTRNLQHHRKGVFGLLPLGQWVFSIGGEGLLSRWDAASARAVESLQVSQEALRAIAYSVVRNEIAVGSSDRCIYLLDAETLALRHVLANAHTNSVFSLAYSPSGQLLLSGGRDAMLRIWELERPFALVSEQPAHWFTINDIVFAPDGAQFATASRDKTIKIWDAQSFELLKVVDTLRFGGHTRSVNRLLWLRDSLISCGDDRSAMLWKINPQ